MGRELVETGLPHIPCRPAIVTMGSGSMTESSGYRNGVSGGGDHGGQRERQEEIGVNGSASHGPGRRSAGPGGGLQPERDPVPRQLDAAGVDADFRDFVRTRGRALLRSAYLLTGNLADAEDLVQSALAKTYLAWERIQDRKALDGYVRRAIVNTHISWWRRRRVDEYPTDEIPDQPTADPSGDRELHDTLQRALDRLPQRMRAAVVLRYFEDMTEAEVADVLGISPGTVKSTVSRAVAKLRTDDDLLAE